MRRSLVVLAVTAIAVAIASPVFAQTRAPRSAQRPVPDTGMGAIGLKLGVALPNETFFTNGLDLGASVEGYITPRVSLRGQLSGAWWDITGHSYTGSVNPIVLDGNIVYNFEHGVWHPYVTAGGGMYHYRFTEGTITSSDTKAGVDFGGGTEYFLTRRDTILGEVLVHVVPGQANGALSTYKPDFWTISFGYKRYF